MATYNHMFRTKHLLGLLSISNLQFLKCSSLRRNDSNIIQTYSNHTVQYMVYTIQYITKLIYYLLQQFYRIVRKFSKMSESYGYIGSVVATYWFISITLVFVNKSLLSGWESLDAPMFVTWYQCLVSVLACYAIRTVSRMFPGRFSFPSLELDPHIIKQVMNGIT